jgi:hypothetical protein
MLETCTDEVYAISEDSGSDKEVDKPKKNVPQNLTPVRIMVVDTVSSVRSRRLLEISLDSGSVAANIGSAIDLDLHEKPLQRIGSIWCQNHVELNLYVFFFVHFFLFSVQNQFFVCSKLLLPILHGVASSKIGSSWCM